MLQNNKHKTSNYKTRNLNNLTKNIYIQYLIQKTKINHFYRVGKRKTVNSFQKTSI